MMKITVIGGGNVGLIMATEMAAKGHDVFVYTSKPEKWSKELEVYDATEQLVCRGNIALATDSLEEAMQGASYIWITHPARVFDELSAKMEPYVTGGQKIGVVPGSGGAEFAFRKLIEKGCILFGLQRVHTIARLKEYGKSSYMLGRKPCLQLAAIPSRQAAQIAETVSFTFDLPCEVLPNYLNVTLTPSNPILHTTRLYSLFRDCDQGKHYPKNILFYENWDDVSSEMLIACDDELQNLCKILPVDTSQVVSLQDYYDSHSVSLMTKKICSIQAFKGLTSPMIQTSEGWVPDFSSRYFTTDFPYGLKVMIEMARLFQVPVPVMEKVWQWYEQLPHPEGNDCFRLSATQAEFCKLYE